MKFFKRKEAQRADMEFANGFEDALGLLDEEIHDRLHAGLGSIPAKKKGRRRGYLDAMAVVSDVFDLYSFREISAREFSDKTKSYWKATASFREGDGSISKEWDSLGN